MKNSRVLLGGAIIGAVTGLIAAMLLNRRAAKNESETAITAGEGLKLGQPATFNLQPAPPSWTPFPN
ncbi:MAG: hypothetical protein DYG85_14905 [Chloroflexi bacterium CFX1]|nr:hypothetical protein [Chloroflexi bacterium CFX1]